MANTDSDIRKVPPFIVRASKTMEVKGFNDLKRLEREVRARWGLA